MALIGSPPLLLLDEPTSGVDPGARRKIWSLLSYIKKTYGCSIILTSHSMEECEALCSRLAIMVNGQFKCIGSIQHLRTKFGQGFNLVIKIKKEMLKTENYLNSLQGFIAQNIISSVIKEIHDTTVNYHINDKTISWSSLFEVLERCKQSYDLEDYLITDSSLEQIFISFARQS